MKMLTNITLLTFISLLFSSCKKEQELSYAGETFTLTYPSSWSITDQGVDDDVESIEFTLDSGKLIFLTRFSPENPTTLERYAEIVTTNFPKNHHADNPSHKVTTTIDSEPTMLGIHRGFKTSYSINTPSRTAECNYKFFRFHNDNYLIFVETFCEGDFKNMPQSKINRFLSSISPKQN